MKTVLGIDLGTQSLKVVVYDYEARRIMASVSAPLEVRRDDRGTAEQEASWWLNALRTALAKVPAGLRESAQAIAVSGQQHGFVAVDADGKVLIPVKLWCDTSTQDEVDEITEVVGGRERCIELTGNPVLVGYTASKLRWIRKHRPELYRKLAQVLLPHDYLNYVADRQHRDGVRRRFRDRLLDVRTRRWSKELLRAVEPIPGPGRQAAAAGRADTVIGIGDRRLQPTNSAFPRACPVARRRRRQHDGGDRHRQRESGQAER